jgi:hypothetical protein
MVSLTRKGLICGLIESKTYYCQPTTSREICGVVSIIERSNIRSYVHRWYNLSLLSHELIHFPFKYCFRMNLALYVQDDAIMHTSKHHSTFPSWLFRGERRFRSVFWAILPQDFMATNLTGLRPLWLLSVRVLEGWGVSEKYYYISVARNYQRNLSLNFFLRFHEVADLQEHRTEYILAQPTNVSK